MFGYLFLVALLLFGFTRGEMKGKDHDKCETVFTTVTIQDATYYPTTQIVTTTTTMEDGAAQISTVYNNNPPTVTVYNGEGSGLSTVYVTSTVTAGGRSVTEYPNATSTVVRTFTTVLYYTTTDIVIYPPLAITIVTRYTGAPTSLWLSVI